LRRAGQACVAHYIADEVGTEARGPPGYRRGNALRFQCRVNLESRNGANYALGTTLPVRPWAIQHRQQQHLEAGLPEMHYIAPPNVPVPLESAYEIKPNAIRKPRNSTVMHTEGLTYARNMHYDALIDLG